MEALKFHVKDYFLAGRLMITELHVSGLSWNELVSKKYLNMLLKLIELDEKNSIYVIDSLTYIVTHAGERDILEFFSTLRKIVDDRYKGVFITLHPYAFNDDLLIRLRSICDGHISLNVKDVGSRLIRFIVINKLRGAKRSTNAIISFEVDPVFGIKVLPFSQAKA
jgi:flagellar protein FlaH